MNKINTLRDISNSKHHGNLLKFNGIPIFTELNARYFYFYAEFDMFRPIVLRERIVM